MKIQGFKISTILKSSLLASSFLALASACSGGGGGSSSPGGSTTTVVGTDASGTYILQNIQCYNAALTTLTHATTYLAPYSDTIVVSGNSMSETMVTTGCTVTFTGNIVMNSSGLTVSSLKVGTATGGTCTATSNLSGVAITPTTNSTSFTSGQNVSGFTNVAYIYNLTTHVLGIQSIYTDGAGGYCFIVYQKQ